MKNLLTLLLTWIFTILAGSSIIQIAVVIYRLFFDSIDFSKIFYESLSLILFYIIFSTVMSVPTFIILTVTFKVLKRKKTEKNSLTKKLLIMQVFCSVITFILLPIFSRITEIEYLAGCFVVYTLTGVYAWNWILKNKITLTN